MIQKNKIQCPQSSSQKKIFILYFTYNIFSLVNIIVLSGQEEYFQEKEPKETWATFIISDNKLFFSVRIIQHFSFIFFFLARFFIYIFVGCYFMRVCVYLCCASYGLCFEKVDEKLNLKLVFYRLYSPYK